MAVWHNSDKTEYRRSFGGYKRNKVRACSVYTTWGYEGGGRVVWYKSAACVYRVQEMGKNTFLPPPPKKNFGKFLPVNMVLHKEDAGLLSGVLHRPITSKHQAFYTKKKGDR